MFEYIIIGILIFAFIAFFKTVRIVPHRTSFVLERMGKYSRTLDAGFHVLVPFLDKVAYKRSLKEEAVDVPQQTCITRDNVSVGVDGILYIQVVDPVKSAYGIENYKYAVSQLAQTTMRSIFGTFDLDMSFEARDEINAKVVQAVDEASDPWGVKVTRYEVKDIEPPKTIIEAMEQQMKAERKKRADIAESEGKRQAEINRAEGKRQAMIAESEGEKQRRINEAEGRAAEIERVAEATARGIAKIALAINKEGGKDAVNLRIAEQYMTAFEKLARENNTMIIPSTLSDVGGMVAAVKEVLNTIDRHPAARSVSGSTTEPPDIPNVRWDLPKV